MSTIREQMDSFMNSNCPITEISSKILFRPFKKDEPKFNLKDLVFQFKDVGIHYFKDRWFEFGEEQKEKKWCVIFYGYYSDCKYPIDRPCMMGTSKISILEALKDAERKVEDCLNKGIFKEVENKSTLMKE